jgi:hypothetical protein
MKNLRFVGFLAGIVGVIAIANQLEHVAKAPAAKTQQQTIATKPAAAVTAKPPANAASVDASGWAATRHCLNDKLSYYGPLPDENDWRWLDWHKRANATLDMCGVRGAERAEARKYVTYVADAKRHGLTILE